MIIKKWLAFFRGDKPIDWAKLNTNEERMRAIAMAADGELGEMWAAWEKRGMSREGVTYAKVLERRAELGIRLTDEEVALVAEINRRKAIGAKLPPIIGVRN